MKNIAKDIETDIPLEELVFKGITIVGEDRNIIKIYSKDRNINYIVKDNIMNIEVFEDMNKIAHIKIHNWINKELFYLLPDGYYIIMCIKFKGE